MKQVNIDEIVETLQDAHKAITEAYAGYWLTSYEILAERIKAHGIAPPDGYVLVPVEPTTFMIKCGQLGVTTTCTIAIYKAMLSAVEEKDNEQ